MTRLLCFGDLQLGGGSSYGREPGDRSRDQDDVLAMIVQVAIDNEVEAVLCAGDLYEGPAAMITPKHYAIVQERVDELVAAGIQFVAITGNGRHDAAAESVKAPELLRHLGRVSTRPELIEVRCTHQAFMVATLPWVPISNLVAARDGGDRGQLQREAAEMLTNIARGLRADIPEGVPAVLLAHFSVSGATTPAGKVTDEFGSDIVLDADEVAALGYDAVVLGHVHRPQLFHPQLGWYPPQERPEERPFFYVGSPLPCDFSEANTPHGAWILDLDSCSAEATFVPIASRPFITVDVDLTTDRHEELGVNETDAVAAAIATHLPLDDAVVKIRYRATEEQARRIDWPKLRTLLDGCHRIYAITGDIVRAERARVEGLDEEIAPIESVMAWITSNEVDPDRVPELLDLSSRYLQEVGA